MQLAGTMQSRHDLTLACWFGPSKCRYVPAGNIGTMAENGTTPFTPIIVVFVCAKRFRRHYNGQPALLNRRFGGTTTAVPGIVL